MKYSEFETEVRNMGFYVGYSPLYLFVVDRHTEKLASISKEFDMWLDTGYPEFSKLPQEQQAAIFDLLYEIAKTPLAEREEEKRYWLRFTTPTLLKNFIPDGYLNIHRESNELSLSSDKKDTEYFKTIFTESEIAEMDITGFKKIEVMDGE